MRFCHNAGVRHLFSPRQYKRVSQALQPSLTWVLEIRPGIGKVPWVLDILPGIEICLASLTLPLTVQVDFSEIEVQIPGDTVTAFKN